MSELPRHKPTQIRHGPAALWSMLIVLAALLTQAASSSAAAETAGTFNIRNNVANMPTIQVTGRVLRDDGLPAEGAMFGVMNEGIYQWPETQFIRTAPGAWFQTSVHANSRVRIAARAPGFGMNFSPEIAITTTDTTGVEVRLTKTATLGGIVLHANSAPATGAKLKATVIDVVGKQEMRFTVGEVIVGSNGQFLLHDMPIHKPIALAASLVNYPNVVSEEPTSLRAGEQKLDIQLRFDVSREISGVVVNERGEPMNAVAITATPTSNQRLFMKDIRPDATTDANGRFTIRGLKNEPYIVTAYIDVPTSKHFDPVTAKDVAPGTRDLRLVYRDTRIPIEVRLVAGPTKQPVRDAKLTIVGLMDLAADPNDPSHFRGTVRAPGSLSIQASSPTAGTFYGHRNVAEGQTSPRTFEFVLLPNITVTGRVVSPGTGPEPLPVADARVELFDDHSQGNFAPVATTKTDRDGRFTLSNVPRCPHRVRVSPPAPLLIEEISYPMPGAQDALANSGNILVTTEPR